MADMEIISWVTPSGVETVLSDNDFIHVVGWEGLQMVGLRHIEQETPFEFGSRYKRTKVEPREVSLNCMVWGEGREGLFQNIARLRTMFDFQRGIGKLKVTTPERKPLELHCLYTSGLQGESGTRDDGVCWQKVVLSFRAFDPFFYGPTVNQSFLLEENPQNFFPLPPVYLAGDAIASEITLEVDGDVTALPNWTITGPGENPKMINITTGRSLELENVSLSAGETININTKERTITKNDGSNLFPRLKWGTGFFDLVPGTNQIQIIMAVADVNSRIDLYYQPRYWGIGHV